MADDQNAIQRLERLEDQFMALGAIVQATFQQTFPQGAGRREAREMLCGVIEEMFADPRIPRTEQSHFRLQRALAYVEEMAAG